MLSGLLSGRIISMEILMINGTSKLIAMVVVIMSFNVILPDPRTLELKMVY